MKTETGKKYILKGAAVLIVVILCIAIGYRSSAEYKVSRQLALGEKYLDEMDYEQAIAAFEKAVEIDPNNEEARKGLVESYIGTADMYTDERDIKAVLEFLEEGYALMQDECLEEKIHEIEKKLEKNQPEKIVYSENEEPVIRKGSEMEDLYENYSEHELSEYLNTMICCLREDYLAEDLNHEVLLKFARCYFENFDHEKIIWDEQFPCVLLREDIDDVLQKYFDIKVPQKNAEEINYRNGKFYYSGDYAYDLGMPLAIIKHVDMGEDETYLITFYNAYVWPEDFESGEQNPIENWEVYYDYGVEEAEKDKFCEINGEGTCRLREKDGRLIVVELKRGK